MKNKNMTNANISHLCELGFGATSNPRIFAMLRARVVFSDLDNSIKVERQNIAGRRGWRIWRVETFFDALSLLEKLGVK